MKIYSNKLGYGEPTNGDATSDSVSELQRRLGIPVTGAYDIRTDEAVRTWQGAGADPAGRSYLGPLQRTSMFPAALGYEIVDAGLPVITNAPTFLAPYAIWNPIDGSPGLRAFSGDAKKITLHTTETNSKPNWAAQGTGLPHFTFDPMTGTTWQHLPLDIAAYTMIGGTNSPNSAAGINIQIEMIGYATNVPNWEDKWYDNLRDLLVWIGSKTYIPMVFPFPFTGSDGFGAEGKVRQTWASFAGASGIVGHAHAPYNTHWDPGNLDTARLFPPPPVEPPVEYVTKAEFDALKKALLEGTGYLNDVIGDLP